MENVFCSDFNQNKNYMNVLSSSNPFIIFIFMPLTYAVYSKKRESLFSIHILYDIVFGLYGIYG